MDPRYRSTIDIENENSLPLKDSLLQDLVGVSVKLGGEDEGNAGQEAEGPAADKRKKLSLGGLLKPKQRPATRRLTHREKAERELAHYMSLEVPMAVGGDDADPLDFCRAQSTYLPLLSSLSKQLLCQCATSCASERLFSLSGHIVSKKRSSYKPDIINTLAFLAFNLKK